MPSDNLILYSLCIFLLSTGMVGVFLSSNLIRKLISLNVAQSAIIISYLVIGYKSNGATPIIKNTLSSKAFVDPVPQVLMLTAIVVGLATTIFGLSLILQINKYYQSTSDECINEKL